MNMLCRRAGAAVRHGVRSAVSARQACAAPPRCPEFPRLPSSGAHFRTDRLRYKGPGTLIPILSAHLRPYASHAPQSRPARCHLLAGSLRLQLAAERSYYAQWIEKDLGAWRDHGITQVGSLRALQQDSACRRIGVG